MDNRPIQEYPQESNTLPLDQSQTANAVDMQIPSGEPPQRRKVPLRSY